MYTIWLSLSGYVIAVFIFIAHSAASTLVAHIDALIKNYFTGNEDAVTKQISGMHTTLSGLRRYTNYSVTVCAFTAAGDGVRAAPVYCHTEEDGEITCIPNSMILKSKIRVKIENHGCFPHSSALSTSGYQSCGVFTE